MLTLLETFCRTRVRRSESRIGYCLWRAIYRVVRLANGWLTRSFRSSDPLSLLCMIGVPLLLASIFGILAVEGVEITPLLESIATIAAGVTLCFFVIAFARYVRNRLRAIAAVLPECTPPHTQMLLRLLPRLIQFLALPVLLLSAAGDTSGLLGLLCCTQMFLMVIFIGTFTSTFVRAWKYEAILRQQREHRARRLPRSRQELSGHVVPHVLYARSSVTSAPETHSPVSPKPSQYAEYEQPQAQYPQQMPPS